MLETLISVGGSLLGGLFGNSSKKKAAAQERAWALEDQREQFVRMRAAAEKGGFNPLAVLGAAPGSGMVAQTSAPVSTFGSSIAESALLLADGLANRKTASISLKNNSLQMANDRLQRKLTGAILRPKIGGVYSGNRPRMGIGNANAASLSSGVRGGVSSHADRVEPKARNVAESVGSYGQETRVPIGPDIDEMMTGAAIDWWNQVKANRNPPGWRLPSARRSVPQSESRQGRMIPNPGSPGPLRGGGAYDDRALSETGEFAKPSKKRRYLARSMLPPVMWNLFP